MFDLDQAILERHSIRMFLPHPVPRITREHLSVLSSVNHSVRIAVAFRSKPDAAAMAGKLSICRHS